MGAQQTSRRRWQIGLCASAALVVSVVLFFVFAALVESSRVHKGLGQIAALQRAPGEFDDDSNVDDLASKGLIDELIKAEVIPTVIDAFAPLLNVSISWPDFDANLGNTGSPSDLQDTPKVRLIDTAPDAWARWWGSVWDGDRDVHHARPQLTLILTDPDAPSRENPKNSEFCHWIATGFPLTTDGADTSGDVSEMKHFDEIIPYRPPGPPPKTGKHRYVFVALVPSNGTSEKLDLRKPEERARWGYSEQRHGVRQWAHEMGLSVIGANFIYAQDDEQ